MLRVVSQNVQAGAETDGRWEHLAGIIRAQDPQLVMLQECAWLAEPAAVTVAEKALQMRILVAPSRTLNVAVAWDPDVLSLSGSDLRYSGTDLHHGYCAPRFDIGGRWPLVAISTHLIPYSAAQAAIEAQIVGTRAYRHGGLGLIAGDINHVPLGDEDPDWDQVQPYNRMSRCRRRTSIEDPWQGDTIVAETLRDGDFTDVAAYLGDQRADPSLRAPTGKAGRVRVDQAHVTPALAPTIVDYWRVDPGEYSDHFGIAFTLDLDLIDWSKTRDHT